MTLFPVSMSVRTCLRGEAWSRLFVTLLLLVTLPACAAPPYEMRLPEPHSDHESPVDLIESLPTPSITIEEKSPRFEIPDHLRDVLDKKAISDELLHLFIEDQADAVPDEIYRSVFEFVDFFHVGRARRHYSVWLAREARYGPMIRTELREAGLPDDLVYFAMIESGFANSAVLSAGAVGMWQFVAATARDLGMRIDEWVDERRDPVSATRAAIRYLKWLHTQTGSWALAAAAYNAGLGRISRIQREAGETDYFRLVALGRLPAETRRYVPAIVAASLIAHNREIFGFDSIPAEPPFVFDTVRVEPLTLLSAIAQAAGVKESEVRSLNAHLIRAVVPPETPLYVRIPKGRGGEDFYRALGKIPPSKRFLPQRIWVDAIYVVQSGDSWWKIAKNHGIGVTDLREWNRDVPDLLHPGMKLRVRKLQDVYGNGAIANASENEIQEVSRSDSVGSTVSAVGGTRGSRSTDSSRERIHRVESGETMSGLAKRYGISLADLARWNKMEKPRPLRIGETLRLVPPDTLHHVVSPGESMEKLARQYGITVQQILKWNNMSEPRWLRIGERIVVGGPDD